MKATFDGKTLHIAIPVKVSFEQTEQAPFTKRQTQIMDALREGKLNKEIADDLGISERTVKFHVSELLRLNRCQSRYQLVRKFDMTQAHLEGKRAERDWR